MGDMSSLAARVEAPRPRLGRADQVKVRPASLGPPVWKTGKADKGESVTAAAARELKGETGLTVDPASVRVAGIIHGAWGVEAPIGFPTVIFAARTWQGEPVNAEPRKHAPAESLASRLEARLR